jgi:hypothetical protein
MLGQENKQGKVHSARAEEEQNIINCRDAGPDRSKVEDAKKRLAGLMGK